MKAFNTSDAADRARKDAGVASGEIDQKGGVMLAAVQYELNFAKALIDAEKLGTHDVTDVLTLSISSTDILGHQVGPTRRNSGR